MDFPRQLPTRFLSWPLLPRKCLYSSHFLSLTLFEHASVLPKPIYAPTVSDDEEEEQPQVAQSSAVIVTRQVVPPYGKRKGWKPTSQADFGESALNESFRILNVWLKAMAERIPNAMSLSIRWRWARRKRRPEIHSLSKLTAMETSDMML